MRDSLFHFAEFGALINFVAFHGLFGDFGHFDRLSHFAKKKTVFMMCERVFLRHVATSLDRSTGIASRITGFQLPLMAEYEIVG